MRDVQGTTNQSWRTGTPIRITGGAPLKCNASFLSGVQWAWRLVIKTIAVNLKGFCFKATASKKRGHSERSVGVGEGGGPTRGEESRGMAEQRPVLSGSLASTHGIAPPSPSQHSAQNDSDFVGSSRTKNHARVLYHFSDDFVKTGACVIRDGKCLWSGAAGKVVHGFSRHGVRTLLPAKAVDYVSRPRTVRPVYSERWYYAPQHDRDFDAIAPPPLPSRRGSESISSAGKL